MELLKKNTLISSYENDYILIVRLVQRVEGLVKPKGNACSEPRKDLYNIKENAVVRLLLLFKDNKIG